MHTALLEHAMMVGDKAGWACRPLGRLQPGSQQLKSINATQLRLLNV